MADHSGNRAIGTSASTHRVVADTLRSLFRVDIHDVGAKEVMELMFAAKCVSDLGEVAMRDAVEELYRINRVTRLRSI